ncbi:MAG: hypothetical protein ACFFAN_13640, partial [Promethearchaeota archaeon]
SELIRCAVREFLLRELNKVKNRFKYVEHNIDDFDDKNYVRVPIEMKNENEEPVHGFKTYKILRKLDY